MWIQHGPPVDIRNDSFGAFYMASIWTTDFGYGAQNHPKARVEMPNAEEIEAFKAAINLKYPSLSNVWGSMDGLKLFLQQAGKQVGKPDVQNYFYNGWTHDHYVSNLFLFSPDGKIRKYFLNAPGCWHDSTLANASGITMIWMTSFMHMVVLRLLSTRPSVKTTGHL